MIGLDFGTTNSAIALAAPDRSVRLARFSAADGPRETFRSLLYFDAENLEDSGKPRAATGHDAIARYLETHGSGRLIQSLKSYLASRLFKETCLLEFNFTLEDLIACMLRDLRAAAQRQFGALPGRVVVGRPVHFVRAEQSDEDELALSRLRKALHFAGFDEVELELEPVAAAYHYEARLDHDELILIGDFGGGTSDFCLLRVGPSARRHGVRQVLGTEGVGIAGDVFDSRLVRHLVAPHLGLGSTYRAPFGEALEVPRWIYGNFERWHLLSFLRTVKTMNMLREVRASATEPAKIEALIRLVDDDVGYDLYRSVEAVKEKLSVADAAVFRFAHRGIVLESPVTREQFEQWIAGDLAAIEACVRRLLERSGVAARDVDRVFLTGGSSFVPAVRRIFERRFGAGKLQAGNELTSVAMGLALRALDG